MTTLGITTNNDDNKYKKVNEMNEPGNDNQKLTSSDKPTTEVTLLVKFRTEDVTSSLVRSKPKSLK